MHVEQPTRHIWKGATPIYGDGHDELFELAPCHTDIGPTGPAEPEEDHKQVVQGLPRQQWEFEILGFSAMEIPQNGRPFDDTILGRTRAHC